MEQTAEIVPSSCVEMLLVFIVSSTILRHVCYAQAMYAPLYKADNRTDISLIESPFSQSLTISKQGPARDAPWAPERKLGSPFMSASAVSPSSTAKRCIALCANVSCEWCA